MKESERRLRLLELYSPRLKKLAKQIRKDLPMIERLVKACNNPLLTALDKYGAFNPTFGHTIRKK